MRRAMVGLGLSVFALTACSEDIVSVNDPGTPAAPRAVAASYYAGSVTVTWELAPAWNGEAFRVYSRRVTDSEWFFIAEVTSCAADFCTYEDINVVAGETYEYLVSAINDAGVETSSDIVEVFVPQPVAPPVPDGTAIIALDGANYVTWGDAARDAGDFSHYRVYWDDDGTAFLLGETDSEGFLDLLAQNGSTYGYFVTSVDTDGHESDGSVLGEGTPRPDFAGELLHDFFDDAATSGFLFTEDESIVPVVDGSSPAGFDFRVETDVNGDWWMVLGDDAAVYQDGFATTALKCGVAADADCVDVSTAPVTGYVTNDMPLLAETSYVLRVLGADGLNHYGVVRLTHLGVDQTGGVVILDWAYQLQAGNPDLISGAGG